MQQATDADPRFTDAKVDALVRDGPLLEGDRIGRFLILQDIDGRIHAVAASSIVAISDTDDGALLLLPAGRLLLVARTSRTVLEWLDGRR